MREDQVKRIIAAHNESATAANNESRSGDRAATERALAAGNRAWQNASKAERAEALNRLGGS